MFFLLNAMKLAAVKVWGANDTTQTPLIDECLQFLFYTAIVLDLTLPEIALLINPSVEFNRMRENVAERLPAGADSYRSAWKELCYYAEKKPIEFTNKVGSTSRRLSAFINNPRIKRIYGVPNISLDLRACMDEGGVLIVDLSPKGKLHLVDARLIGTFMLADFYVQMFNRKRPDRPFTLYIDEFQNFATNDLTDMLDQARNFGLRFVLAHQRPGQLLRDDPDLYSAVMTNARNKVVFGGIDPQELEPIARNISTGVLDPNKIKREIYSKSVVSYVKEYWDAQARSRGRSHTNGLGGGSSRSSASGSGSSYGTGSALSGDGLAPSTPLFISESQSWQEHFAASEATSESWMEADTDSETESLTTFPVLVPQIGEQLNTVYYDKLEDQLFQFMAILHDQKQRQAMVKVVDQNEPIPIYANILEPRNASAEAISRQLALSYQHTGVFLPVEKANALVEERRQAFLKLGQLAQAEPSTYSATVVENDMIDVDSMTDDPSSKLALKVNGVELQPRDLDLLADLFDTRFTTIRHTAALYFDGKESTAKQRLLKLYKAGLIEKKDVRTVSNRGAKTLYVFKKATLDLLCQHGYLLAYQNQDWDSKLRKRFTDIAASTIEHELCLLDIRAALQPSFNDQPHLRVTRFGTWPLEYEFFITRQGRQVKQQPAGYFCYAEHSPNHEQPKYHHFFLEYDRGTETLETLQTKVEGYRQYYRNGGFCRWLNQAEQRPEQHPFRVLLVVPSVSRLSNIMEKILAMGV